MISKCKIKTNNNLIKITSYEIIKKKLDIIDKQDKDLMKIRLMSKCSIIYEGVDETSVPLFKNSYKLMIIPVIINNITYNFLLDTGAQCSCIVKSIYQELKLSNNSSITVPIGSSTGVQNDMELFTLPQLSVGNIIINNNCFCILKDEALKLPGTDNNNLQMFGIIGWDILKNLNVEIDNDSIKFVNKKVVNNKYSKNLISTSYPVILVTDELGNEYAFGFDSGAKRSCLNKDSEITNNIVPLKTENINTYGAHGSSLTKEYVYENIIININNKKIIFEDINTGYCDYYRGFKLDGILGVDIIKNQNFKLYGLSNQFII